MKLSRQFPLNAMRVFEAVARHGSFTRAAEELGMTQTAVSYQIKLLEENLGEPLFLRKPRQIVRTEVAERILPNVTQAFDLLNDAVSSARQTANETLTIHSSPAFGAYWLSKNLGTFQLQNPSMAVRFKRVATLSDFDRDGADVAVRWGKGPWDGLECHHLGQLIFAPMMSPTYAEKVGPISSPEDLLKLTLIGAQDIGWLEWFEAAGVSDVDLSGQDRYRYLEQDLCANAALAGLGVTILDRIYFYDDLQAGRLVEPFPIHSNFENGIWLVYPPKRRNAPKVKAFREWISKAVADDLARTAPPGFVSRSQPQKSRPSK